MKRLIPVITLLLLFASSALADSATYIVKNTTLKFCASIYDASTAKRLTAAVTGIDCEYAQVIPASTDESAFADLSTAERVVGTVGQFCYTITNTEGNIDGEVRVSCKASNTNAADYERVFTTLVSDANATKWNGTAVATPATAGYPAVTIKDGTGTGEIDTNAGAVVAVTTATTCTTASTCTNLTNLPTIPANWLTAAGLAADAGTEIGTANWATTTRQLTSAQTFDLTGNISGTVGSVTGAVGSVTGSVGSVSGAVGSVTGNVGGTVNGLTAVAVKDLFDTDSTTTYASAIAGSLVKEIADNAGGSALSEAGIAAAVWAYVTRQLTGAQTFDLTGNISGSVGSVTGAVGSVTGAVGSIGAGGITATTLAADTITAAKIDATADTEIKNQVIAALTTDTYAELAACPTATASITDMLQFLFMDSRNKITATSTSQLLKKDDASTTLCTFTTADDGTVFTRGEGS